MNYFIITSDRKMVSKIENNYKPVKYFDLLDRDLSKEEFFIYVVDIMYEVYAGNNVLIATTNYKGIKNLFNTINTAEVPNYYTIFMIDTNNYKQLSTDNYKLLDNSKIDEIIIEENNF